MSEVKKLEVEIFNLKNENAMLKRKLNFSQRLDALEGFCERVECVETDFEATLIEIKAALKAANSFEEFKNFVLEKEILE